MSGSVKLIDNYIYFSHLNLTGSDDEGVYCVLPLYPETIVDSMTTTFATTNALARTAPVFTYSNSGPRSVSINFSLHRDLMNDINLSNKSNFKSNVVDIDDDYIDILIKYLQASALPRYEEYSTGSKCVIPPTVAIRFGNDVFIKGVVNSNISVTYKKPILYNNKYACAEINFTVFETDPYDAESVVEEGSFRGLTKTFRDGIYKDTVSSKVADADQINTALDEWMNNAKNGLDRTRLDYRRGVPVSI